MFLFHLGLGLVIIIPTIIYGLIHISNTKNRRNRRAIKAGYLLFFVSILLLLSGLLLTREIPFFEVKNTILRNYIYWLHVILPLVSIWAFVMHRLAGPKLKWKPLTITAVVSLLFVAGMFYFHYKDLNSLNQNITETNPLFLPSLSQTATQEYYQPHEIDNNQYCQECHQDIHEGWLNSVHKVSSFNNASYAFAVNQTKEFLKKRDGNHDEARFCGACHDPVLMFSGEFDKEQDFTNTKLGNAGITCTSCHAISKINSLKGNGAYTLDIPEPYPFTDSYLPFLQWVNKTLVKAKPDFHKNSYLKPLHKTAEFCSTCHKVSIPESFNDYKWLRGQNHFDSFFLSGVSGHAVASFYYPPKAKTNCASCHMPLTESNDFGAISNGLNEKSMIHSHYFQSANSAIRKLNNLKPDVNNDMLKDSVKVNIFGVRTDGIINGELIAPLKGNQVEVQSGKTYLFETYVRTLTLGHAFTQGTVDSNQVWVEFNVFQNGELLFQNGGINSQGEVDDWSFFINAYIVDKEGNRIDRRNVEDIFTALYNHNIPPGAAATIHYQLNIPEDIVGQIDIEAKVHYRKFDTNYYRLFTNDANRLNDLPIVELSKDQISLNVVSEEIELNNDNLQKANWDEWNDYGIGLLRTRAFKQAEQAFLKVTEYNRAEGWINLTRVYIQQGLLKQAQESINKAAQIPDFKYPWQLSYFSAVIDAQNGFLSEAIDKFEKVFNTEYVVAQDANFDFSKDFRFVTMYAQTVFNYSKTQNQKSQTKLRNKAIELFKHVLELDPEWADAHFGLFQVYAAQKDIEQAQLHKALHKKYKTDDNAKDRVIALARAKNPAAENAAEEISIYPVQFNSDNKTIGSYKKLNNISTK